MGKIEGDLSVVGVSNLLQILSDGGLSGVLTVSEGEQRKVIEFTTGGIRLLSGTRRATPLGEILIRAGKITHDELEELLAEQKRVRKPLGEIVSDRGLLSPGVIEGALREQAAEEICDLFTWTRATFRFVGAGDEAAPPPTSPLASVVLESNMMSIMLEAARRVDELVHIQAVIPDARLVPARLELPTGTDDPTLDRNAVEDILPLVDGARSVGQIIDESLYPKFTVLRTLYGLVQRGAIKLRDHGNPDGPVTVFQRPSSGGDSPNAGGETVLLLGEAPGLRGALAVYLRRAGVDVREADRWDQAEERDREGVKAVVLDAPLETEEGLAECARLRQAAAAPLIVLSAAASRKAVRNAIRSGASFVLLKPLQESLLLERLQTVFQESSLAVDR
jgi:CheY-like chemotaxis protein